MANVIAEKAKNGGRFGGCDEVDLAALVLQHEIEQFYYHEAALLDGRLYRDWLNLFTPDVHYFMPIRRTKTTKDLDKEFTQPGDMALFDDDHFLLSARVRKLETGYSWAEDPPSRQRHLVTNVRILGQAEDEIDVESGFHFYRTRLHSEEDTWIGHRKDVLRRVEGELKIARRAIYLEQTILLARNLSNFF
ncbi:MAG: 3-phenylpropionate/cinnamic acid dioxygenase subunit beta [Hyphomonas sp.]|nr:3-phenylpropionate/cinnamic acid dioxygenase subunit beta [Hyphomonas sp.]MCC0017606.1 3-phenylpropionate/cinnamic acid dioxygenase subunit beta [Rhodobiaceae bacterium]